MGGDAREELSEGEPTGPDPATVALGAFRDAALMWAGTGYGKPLVDAAADALAAGLDTPTLRVLAGAPARFADEEATEYAPDTFGELGLSVPGKHSEEAYLELARLKARLFLEGDGSARRLAADLWLLYVNSGYRSELADFSGFDDWYAMLDERVMQGDVGDVDVAVRESAQRLVDGLPSKGSVLAARFMEHQPPASRRASLLDRIRQKLRRQRQL